MLFMFRKRNTSGSDNASWFYVLLKNAPIDVIISIKSVSEVNKDKCPENSSVCMAWPFVHFGDLISDCLVLSKFPYGAGEQLTPVKQKPRSSWAHWWWAVWTCAVPYINFSPGIVPRYYPSTSCAVSCPQTTWCRSSWHAVPACTQSHITKNIALGQILCLVDVTSLFQLVQRSRGRNGAGLHDQFPTM